MKHFPIVFIVSILFIVSSCDEDDETRSGNTVKDIDGNVYHTVTIGTQVWMVENLKTTKYRNGVSIEYITDTIAWRNDTTGAFCYYDNDSINNVVYGKLYNGYTVTNSNNIAPTGWHVPTDSDWAVLVTYLGGDSVAGGKLKETDTTHWISPNTGATNETGFTALPGGYREYYGRFLYIGESCGWWSSTRSDYFYLGGLNVSFDGSRVYHSGGHKQLGRSVRCVRN